MTRLIIVAFGIFLLSPLKSVRAQDYQTFTARNSVEIEYLVLLPEDYRTGESYPAVVAFSGSKMDRVEAEQMICDLWEVPAHQDGWIVIVPLNPGEDWRTHPHHHALNDLMDEIKDRYSIAENTFHILGLGDDGAGLASTWGGMSREYFSALVAVDGTPFSGWSDENTAEFLEGEGKDLPLVVFASERSEEMDRFLQRMQHLGKEVSVHERPVHPGGVLGRVGHTLNSL